MRPKNAPINATIKCESYRRHMSNHRLIDGRWVCAVCHQQSVPIPETTVKEAQ